MVGNWMDDRERQFRGREARGSRDARRDGGEDRSWDDRPDMYGARRGGPDRDRVFGEGETGASYGARPPSGAMRGAPSSGWQDRHYGGVSPAMRQGAYDRRPRFTSQDYTGQDYSGGGRFYGDDDRGRIYREEYGQGGVEYGDVPPGYDAARGRYPPEGYGQAGYDDRGDGDGRRLESRGERFEGAGRGAGEFLHRAGERVAAWFGAGSESRIYDPEFQGRSARGKGPQGYKRSDERINDDAHDRLTDDPWLDATGVTVSVSAGEVTLSGTVESREAKHRAEQIVEDITGVCHVQNNLRLDRGGVLARPAPGYRDSVLDAEMRSDDPVANGTGGAGAGQSTAGRKN